MHQQDVVEESLKVKHMMVAGGRWQGVTWGTGRGRESEVTRDQHSDLSKSLVVKELDCQDTCPPPFPFIPPRSVGVHLLADINPNCAESLFKLFFNDVVIQMICKASDEYAELHKDTKPVIYSYYKGMLSADLYKLIGIIVHLGYRKIPRYRLAWSPKSLCYDPIISQVMSRNLIDGLMSFLHVVERDTEATLKEAGDKLAKIRTLNDHLNRKCREYYQPNREASIDERMVCSKLVSFK